MIYLRLHGQCEVLTLHTDLQTYVRANSDNWEKTLLFQEQTNQQLAYFRYPMEVRTSREGLV